MSVMQGDMFEAFDTFLLYGKPMDMAEIEWRRWQNDLQNHLEDFYMNDFIVRNIIRKVTINTEKILKTPKKQKKINVQRERAKTH